MTTRKTAIGLLVLMVPVVAGAIVVLFYFPGLYWFASAALVRAVETEETVVYEMRWSRANALPSGHRKPHVVLEFVEFPGFYERLSGTALEQHLGELESNTVGVEFVLRKVFGRVVSYRIAQVGVVRWPEFRHLGAGRRGPPREAPFGRGFWHFF